MLRHGVVVIVRHGHLDDAARTVGGMAQRAIGELRKEVHATRHRTRQGVRWRLLPSHPLDDGTHRQGGGDRGRDQHPHGEAASANGNFTVAAISALTVARVGTGIGGGRTSAIAVAVVVAHLGHAFVVRWTNRWAPVVDSFDDVGCVMGERGVGFREYRASTASM